MTEKMDRVEVEDIVRVITLRIYKKLPEDLTAGEYADLLARVERVIDEINSGK